MSIASEITRINTNIANAYTQCNNKGATMPSTQNSANLADTISTITTGGGGKPEQSKTTNPSTSQVVVEPDTGYTLSSVTVNAMPSGALSTPTINTSTGVVTASVGTSGYIASGTSATLQLSTQSSQTITPTTTNQTISSGKYLTGTQTISGDANLVAGNIKKDTTIFGVTGSYEGGGGSATLITKSITQNGTYNAYSDSADGYSQVTVNVSGGGTVEPEEKNVNFYDYDGTRLYSYTKAEFLELESMPENPTHEGLIAKGWNRYLNDTKKLLEVYDKLEVGQYYETTDGSTKIYIKLTDEFKSPSVYFGFSGTCTIDWGDGTTTSATSSNNWINATHTYSSGGKYVISIMHGNNALTLRASSGSGGATIVGGLLWGGSSADSAKTNLIYASCVEEIRLGKEVRFDASVLGLFKEYINLKTITFPKAYDVGKQTFYNCHNLKCVTGIKNIKDRVFENCYSLKRCLCPKLSPTNGEYAAHVFTNCSSLKYLDSYFAGIYDSVPSLRVPYFEKYSYLFKGCYSITKVTLPYVLDVGERVFSDDYPHIKIFDFTRNETVPTLANTNAFAGGTSDYEIWVPSSLYNSWITASNWSSISSHIVSK